MIQIRIEIVYKNRIRKAIITLRVFLPFLFSERHEDLGLFEVVMNG